MFRSMCAPGAKAGREALVALTSSNDFTSCACVTMRLTRTRIGRTAAKRLRRRKLATPVYASSGTARTPASSSTWPSTPPTWPVCSDSIQK